MNLFLRGEIQVGKTTAINKYINENHIITQGFKTFTGKSDENNVSGVYIQDFNKPPIFKPKYLIAERNISLKTLVKHSKTLDEIGTDILKRIDFSSGEIIILDEIGFIEDTSFDFQKEIIKCLNEKTTVLGVLKKREGTFIKEILKRNDIVCLDVTLENRETISKTIKEILNKNNFNKNNGGF